MSARFSKLNQLILPSLVVPVCSLGSQTGLFHRTAVLGKLRHVSSNPLVKNLMCRMKLACQAISVSVHNNRDL